MAEPIVFGTNVNFIRYDEAEEIASVPGTFAGWGGTIVIQLYINIIIESNNSNKRIIVFNSKMVCHQLN